MRTGWKKAWRGGSFRNPISSPTQRRDPRGVERVSMVWGGRISASGGSNEGGKNEHNGIIFHGCRSRSTLAGPIEQDRRIDLTVRTRCYLEPTTVLTHVTLAFRPCLQILQQIKRDFAVVSLRLVDPWMNLRSRTGFNRTRSLLTFPRFDSSLRLFLSRSWLM